MDAWTNTREGGKERTAAAGSASRDFQPGDPVAITFCGLRTRGEIVRVVDGEFDLLLVRTGNVEVYRNGSDVSPIEPAPEFIEAAVMDDEPLTLDDVADEDAVVAASLDAATLLVRICAADDLPFCERVTLNGVTWLVEAKPE
jgi:hypothetical protein